MGPGGSLTELRKMDNTNDVQLRRFGHGALNETALNACRG